MSDLPEKRLDTDQLFATPIMRVRHPALSALVSPLEQVILQRRREHGGVQRSNQGGWHSDTDMMSWAGPAATQLSEIAVDMAHRQLSFEGAPKHLRPGWQIDMWANASDAGHSNAQHCHPGAFVSCVFYVSSGFGEAAPADGEILFEDPRYPLAYQQYPGVFWKDSAGQPVQSQTAIQPQVGDFILFPSWLRHSVRPHSGAGTRISIAMNLILEWHPVDGGQPHA